MLQNIIQGIGTERISGAGRLDRMLLDKARNVYPEIFIICTAYVFSKGNEYQRNLIFFADQSCSLIIVRGSEQKFHFII